MAGFAQSFVLGASLLSGEAGAGLETPLVILGLYFIHLLVSSGVLFLSVRVIGGGGGFLLDFPRALFTVFIRDLLLIPLLFLVLFIPYFGIIIAMVVWLGLIKYIFTITWVQALLAWLISMILSTVVVIFIILPLTTMLIPGLF